MKNIIGITALLAILILVESGFCYQADEKWEDITHGIDELDLRTVAIDIQNPNIIYAGSAKSIFKTIDGGKNWQKLYMIRGTLTSVNIISIDPRNTNVIYAGTQSGLYKSSNAGISWEKVFEGIGPQEKNIRHISIEDRDANKICIGTGNGIFTTIDAGRTWNKMTNEISNQAINFIMQATTDTDIIYVATNSGVFKSENHGSSFKRIFTAMAQNEGMETDEISQDINIDEAATFSNKTPNCVGINIQDNNKIYIGTNAGLFTSSDAGKTWEKLTSSGLTNNKVTSLTLTKDDVLYAATKNGIFKISAPYQKWNETYSGLISKDIRYLAYNQSNSSILAATEKGIYQTYLVLNPNLNPKDNSSIPSEDIAKILARFESEPSIQEIQQAAIKYAEVPNEKIKEWRKGAKRKAMLPKVSVGVDESEGDYYYTGTWRGKDEAIGWNLSLAWDLGELIWNNDQNNIDVRSRLMVQLRDDILDEVTRLYFERRRLQIEVLTRPPNNFQYKLEKELRLQELTAGIDALTGGYLSKKMQQDAVPGHSF